MRFARELERDGVEEKKPTRMLDLLYELHMYGIIYILCVSWIQCCEEKNNNRILHSKCAVFNLNIRWLDGTPFNGELLKNDYDTFMVLTSTLFLRRRRRRQWPGAYAAEPKPNRSAFISIKGKHTR